MKIGHRRAARDDRLQCAALGDAVPVLEDQLAQRRAERQLVVAGAVDVPRERVDDRSRRGRDADLRVALGAELDDRRDAGERLHVVDQRRLHVQPRNGRERRPRARLTPLALERIEHRRLLAADVRAGAAMDDDLDVAEHAGGAGLLDRRLEHLVLGQVFAADVDEDVPGLDRVRRDQAALDEAMGNPAHDLAVLERARLGLVRVGDDVARSAAPIGAGNEAQLPAHREPGAPASSQRGVRNLLDHLLRRHAARLLERAVAADRPVFLELRQVALVGAGEDGEISHREAPRRARGRPRGASARGSGRRRRRPARSRSRLRTRSAGR